MEARPARDDELHHLSTASSSSAWFETFGLEFVAADASIAGYLIATLRPSEDRTWFWACVAGRDRPLVAIVDEDVPLPRRVPLELRASGLWVDVECETPFEHVSVGLEAFGLTLEAPEDAIGDPRGARTPVGFDLEWETDGEPRGGAAAYELPCRVTGELLVGDERFELDVTGRRAHCWGDAPWWERPATEPVDEGAPAGEAPARALVAVPAADRASAVLRSTLVAAPGGHRWRHRLTPG